MAVSSLVPAATGPTLSEITTAGTSAGWGATKGADIVWTQLGTSFPTGTSTVTFSGLSGYKYYKLMIRGPRFTSGTNALFFRLNGDSASNYDLQAIGPTSGSATWNFWTGLVNTWIALGAAGTSSEWVFEVDISNADQASMVKKVDSFAIYYDGTYFGRRQNGYYWGGSAVSSISIIGGNTFNCASPFGFYLYGGN